MPSNTPSLHDPFLLMFKNMSRKAIVQICRIIWHHFMSLFFANGIMRNLLILALFSFSLEAKNPFYDMKKELQIAEKELQSAHSKVLHLREVIAKREIEKMRIELDQMEGTVEEKLIFLDRMRKNISSIMAEVPSCYDETQEVLDDILVAITELKETNQNAMR